MSTNDDNSRRRKRRADCSVAKLMECTTGRPANEEDQPPAQESSEEEEIVDIAAALAEAEKKRQAKSGLIIKRSINTDTKDTEKPQQINGGEPGITTRPDGVAQPAETGSAADRPEKAAQPPDAEKSAGGPEAAHPAETEGTTRPEETTRPVGVEIPAKPDDNGPLEAHSETTENSKEPLEELTNKSNFGSTNAPSLPSVSGDSEKGISDATSTNADNTITTTTNNDTAQLKSTEQEQSSKGEATSPFGVFGGVFSAFPLAANGPQPFQLSSGNSLDKSEGANKEVASLLTPNSDIAVGRPQVFPGEEDEELVFSCFNASLSKCYKEEDTFRFRSRGPGVCRILADKSDKTKCRVVFRQAATWHVLLNSPLSMVGNFSGSPPKFKFSAYDCEDKDAAGLCMFALRFVDPSEAKEFAATVEPLIKRETKESS